MSAIRNKKKFSLQARFIFASALAISLTALVGVFCVLQTKQIADTTSNLTDTWLPALQGLGEIRVRSQILRVAQYDAASETDPTKIAAHIKKCDVAASDMFIYNNTVSKQIDSDEAQKIFDSYVESWDNYGELNDDFMKLMKAGKTAEARAVLDKGDEFFAKAQDTIKQLNSIVYKGTMQAKTDAIDMVAIAMRAAIISLPLIFILSLVLIFLVTRKTNIGMTAIATELRSMAELLLNKGDRLAVTSTQLSNSTTKEAEALHQALTTTNAINAKVTENSKRAGETSAAIQETRDYASAGRSAIGQVTSAMSEIEISNRQILDHVEKNNSNMQEIITIMKSIEGKTNVINDIVFQTRLLSFNASVEAARAGEAGKGFSVVAEEIAKLAEMSGSAAQDIGVIIDLSSKKVTDIVHETKEEISSAVADSAQKIQLGLTLTEDSMKTLDQIVSAAEKASEMAKMISVASSEQARSVNEISVAMAQLTETTQANSSLAETTASESKELGTSSNELSTTIQRLELEVHGNFRRRAAD